MLLIRKELVVQCILGTTRMKNTSFIVWRLIPIFFLSLVNLSPSWISGWTYDGESLKSQILTYDHQVAIIPSMSARIEGTEFCVQMLETQVQIFRCNYKDSEPIWQTPKDWEVSEAFFSDLNRDGEKELTLLVWREFQPWPVDHFLPKGGRIDSFHDSNNRSCHLILLGFKNGGFREVWAGSAMADPLYEIHAIDLDGDGVEELVGLEYAYGKSKNDSSLVVWEWNGFGFTLGDRSPVAISNFQPVQNENEVLLLTQ